MRSILPDCNGPHDIGAKLPPVAEAYGRAWYQPMCSGVGVTY
jgi:hypothetical protein